MSLARHLAELRKRLLRATVGILAGIVGSWFLTDWVWSALESPIRQLAKSQNPTINFTNITGAFDLRMQIALILGIILSSPVWLYQLFAFLVPGFSAKEKKYVFGFIFSAIPLFLAGCGAGWLVFPHVVELVASFVPEGSANYYDAKYYFDFVLKLVLVVGIAFELPVFLVLLNFTGVLAAKTILKGWRIAILAIMLFTAIATPAADVLSMLLLAAPMVALYFVAVGVGFLHDRAADRRLAVIDAETLLAVVPSPERVG